MDSNAPSKPGLRQEYLEAYFVTDMPPAGFPLRFGVVTACNPNGVMTSEELNRAADARLRCQLEESGFTHFRVTGGSRDGRHQEPGYGIVTDDREKVRLLSQQFNQEAFFWIEDDFLFWAESGSGTLQKIALWSDRQQR